MFEFVRCSKNDVRVWSIFDRMVLNNKKNCGFYFSRMNIFGIQSKISISNNHKNVKTDWLISTKLPDLVTLSKGPSNAIFLITAPSRLVDSPVLLSSRFVDPGDHSVGERPVPIWEYFSRFSLCLKRLSTTCRLLPSIKWTKPRCQPYQTV